LRRSTGPSGQIMRNLPTKPIMDSCWNECTQLGAMTHIDASTEGRICPRPSGLCPFKLSKSSSRTFHTEGECCVILFAIARYLLEGFGKFRDILSKVVIPEAFAGVRAVSAGYPSPVSPTNTSVGCVPPRACHSREVLLTGENNSPFQGRTKRWFEKSVNDGSFRSQDEAKILSPDLQCNR
jgi:hypothetical protein